MGDSMGKASDAVTRAPSIGMLGGNVGANTGGPAGGFTTGRWLTPEQNADEELRLAVMPRWYTPDDTQQQGGERTEMMPPVEPPPGTGMPVTADTPSSSPGAGDLFPSMPTAADLAAPAPALAPAPSAPSALGVPPGLDPSTVFAGWGSPQIAQLPTERPPSAGGGPSATSQVGPGQ